jgi:NAD(P)-dependent dehydrogenase (short-subunit alcohol dehydrogenase family)
MTVWFITGASGGFGIEITRQALGRAVLPVMRGQGEDRGLRRHCGRHP